MERNKLKEILELHKKWLNGAADGKRASLWGADLLGAGLKGANLQEANLYRADLYLTYLQGADLHGANLRDADIYRADLHGANLHGANLWGADLRGAYLRDADLRGADLRFADLQGADLQGADLQGANLKDANLQGANLHGAKNVPLLPWTSIVPECGSFVGWKKVGNYIIKLKIPDNAKRSNATGRKCRCSEAEVLEIQNLDGTKAEISEIYNDNYYCSTNYVVGKTVTPDSFDDDRWNECSHGIHFFITRQEAVDYA